MYRFLTRLSGLFIIALHFVFILTAIYDKCPNPYLIAIFSGIIALLAFFYIKKFSFRNSVYRKLDVILILFTGLGAVVTYAFNIEAGLGVVLSAGITGLASSLLPYLNRRSEILRELPVAMYCGAFAGMTSPLIANGYAFILAAGLFSGILLIFTKTTLQGFGGKLGTIAFGGVALVSLILYLIF
ncbi:hypothetical protein ML462_11790 [Gramella lutea]|uniref:Uncharacterized protein n=1 Tax=Christiangramia lutea TaxID=1607951 RepID=A0A9X1V7I8_9FLAO|nr:hypothetical protein [Christiangramia lutea]MCH4823853.1 hypothetical protein [Christiangramia lutea]